MPNEPIVTDNDTKDTKDKALDTREQTGVSTDSLTAPIVVQRAKTETRPRRMSLRDHFAGQALTGVFHGSDFDYDDKIVARRCYEVADAMMAERAKAEGR